MKRSYDDRGGLDPRSRLECERSIRRDMSNALARFSSAIREALSTGKRPGKKIQGWSKGTEGTTRDRSSEFVARRKANWKRRRTSKAGKESPQAKQLQDVGRKTMELKGKLDVAITQYAQVIESVHWELEDDSFSPSSRRTLLATHNLLHEEIARLIAELKRKLMVDIPNIQSKSLVETAFKRSLSAVAGETLRVSIGAWRHLSRLCSDIQKSDDAADATRLKREVIAEYECKVKIERLHSDVCAVGDMLLSVGYLQNYRSALAPAIHSTKASLSKALESYQSHGSAPSSSGSHLSSRCTNIVDENFRSPKDILVHLTHANNDAYDILCKHSVSDGVYREEMSFLLQTLKEISEHGTRPPVELLRGWMNRSSSHPTIQDIPR